MRRARQNRWRATAAAGRTGGALEIGRAARARHTWIEGAPGMQQPSFTLGVEEEYQIVDPETRALRAHIGRMLADQAFDALGLKPELHQSMVELATPVCKTPAEVRRELLR